MGQCNLKAVPGQGQLRLCVEGRIDSASAGRFGDAVKAARAQHPAGRIVFDCKGLEYVSSAGLRVFLSLKKREKEPIRLVNVSQSVHEILDVTGFSQLLDVSREIREISPQDCKFIGRSHNISLYQMPDDTIMKVYPEGASLDAIERERANARMALLNGIPTLIAYDVVSYEGNYGLLYERLKLDTVSSALENAPWKLEKYAAEMGKLLRAVHSAEPEPGALPKTSGILEGWAHDMEKRLNQGEIEALLRLIRAVPEAGTVVYGNYQEHNVFIQQDELLLVNMANLSCGNPVHDLGAACMLHVLEAERFARTFSRMDAIQLNKIWRVMLRAYFDTDDDKLLEGREQIVRAAALLRLALYPASTALSREDEERFAALARRDVFPAAEKLGELLAEARFHEA